MTQSPIEPAYAEQYQIRVLEDRIEYLLDQMSDLREVVNNLVLDRSKHHTKKGIKSFIDAQWPEHDEGL